MSAKRRGGGELTSTFGGKSVLAPQNTLAKVERGRRDHLRRPPTFHILGSISRHLVPLYLTRQECQYYAMFWGDFRLLLPSLCVCVWANGHSAKLKHPPRSRNSPPHKTAITAPHITSEGRRARKKKKGNCAAAARKLAIRRLCLSWTPSSLGTKNAQREKR